MQYSDTVYCVLSISCLWISAIFSCASRRVLCDDTFTAKFGREVHKLGTSAAGTNSVQKTGIWALLCFPNLMNLRKKNYGGHLHALNAKELACSRKAMDMLGSPLYAKKQRGSVSYGLCARLVIWTSLVCFEDTFFARRFFLPSRMDTYNYAKRFCCNWTYNALTLKHYKELHASMKQLFWIGFFIATHGLTQCHC